MVFSCASCSNNIKTQAHSHPATTTSTTVPGVTPTEIIIGTHQPISGSDAPGLDQIAPASAAFYDFINSTGGVHGRSIALKIEDDASDPDQASNVIRQLVLSDNVFAIVNGLGTATHSAVEAFLNAEGVPDLFAGSGCTCWNDLRKQFPLTFGWQPDTEIEGKLLGQYISQYVKTNPSINRVGYIYENDQLGHDGIMGLNQEVPASSVVTQQEYSAAAGTMPEANQIISNLEASKVQVAVVVAGAQITALTMEAAAQASYDPIWIVTSSGSDPSTLTPLLDTFGAGAGITFGPTASARTIENGMVSDSYLPLPSQSANPWIQLFKKIHDQYIPNLDFNSQVIYGMAVAYTFYALLQAAGPNPTRQGVIRALQTADINGPGLTPFGYSSSSNQGMQGGQIVTDVNGILQPLGPIYLTGDSGSISEYTQSQPPPPPTF